MLHVPKFLSIGHITRDMRLDGSYSLGGTVTFAALTASRLGLTAGIITCADSQLITELPDHLPRVLLHVRPSATTTTFANQYKDGFRTQYLHARGDSLETTDIPPSWREVPIVLFGPLTQELAPAFVLQFPRRPGA